MKAVALYAITILLLSIHSCAPRQTGSTSMIADKYWTLVEISGNRLSEAQLINREPFMIFSSVDGRVSGNTSCNNFFGNFTLGANNMIKIGQIGATKMACPDMSIEQQVFATLPQVTNYTVDQNMLSLRDVNNAVVARLELGEGK